MYRSFNHGGYCYFFKLFTGSLSFLLVAPAVMEEVSKHLKSLYKHTRYTSDEKTWPPDQPKHFTNLAVIQCKDKQTRVEALLGGGDFRSRKSIQKERLHERIKLGKDVAEIFTPFDDSDVDESPTTIVIEGAPGIGKTTLSKEVAFRWAKGTLVLEKVLVFLIFLIDPIVQSIDNISDLIHYFYRFDDNCSHISKACADYLIKSQGHNVMFILDGYDELYAPLRRKHFLYAKPAAGFIYNLMHRNVLPESTLVITSRPHALGYLSYNADRHVIILGFTEEERCHFVNCFLKNQSEKISILLNYLQSHASIRNLCCIPFNITVLLYLYKQGFALPENSTELYNHFLCNIIYCHLAKHKIDCPENIVDLNTLPQPYNEAIQNLAAFALTAVLDNKVTFTWEEIKGACPKIDEVPGAINGFGLLHAVETYSNLQKSVTLSFIHLSVQEYLAAYHIACLKQEDELQVLHNLFYVINSQDISHSNVAQMYIGLTKGQRPALKEILDNHEIRYYECKFFQLLLFV